MLNVLAFSRIEIVNDFISVGIVTHSKDYYLKVLSNLGEELLGTGRMLSGANITTPPAKQPQHLTNVSMMNTFMFFVPLKALTFRGFFHSKTFLITKFNVVKINRILSFGK
jgi:hypothetical protein